MGEHRLPRVVEAARHLARELDVRHLIDAHGHPLRLVHEDVRRLEQRIAEETVGGRLEAELLHHLLVGGDALEPAERRHHGKEQVELGMLGYEGLDEERAPLGVEAGPQPVRGHLDRALRRLSAIVGVGGQGVPARHEEEALVVVLHPHPVFEGAQIVAEVKLARGTHPGEYAWLGGHGVDESLSGWPRRASRALAMRRNT